MIKKSFSWFDQWKQQSYRKMCKHDLIKKEIYKLNINLLIEFVMCPLQNIMIFHQNQK